MNPNQAGHLLDPVNNVLAYRLSLAYLLRAGASLQQFDLQLPDE